MKHLIIGAGATLAEALAIGNSSEKCPPLIGNFARKMWVNYTPHPVLEEFLRHLGHIDLGDDPRELFYRLEFNGQTNVEQFMEFAWLNRQKKFEVNHDKIPPGYISGFRVTTPGATDDAALSIYGKFWDNMLYHGIGSPLQQYMIECFFENGKGWKPLKQSHVLISHLDPGDLVLNLNYDTVFELALEQMRISFCYSPNEPGANDVLVAKPHGSLNMVINNCKFKFGQPEWLGMPQPSGYLSYSGIIPPRLNKAYSQHPASAMILAPVQNRDPEAIIMWGVGLTESDADLVSLYRQWGRNVNTIDIINPSALVAGKVADLCNATVRHFPALVDWTRSQARETDAQQVV
jgi:hypothetical protein